MNNEQREHIKSMAYRVRRHAKAITESMRNLEECGLPDISGIPDNETLEAVKNVFTDALHYCELSAKYTRVSLASFIVETKIYNQIAKLNISSLLVAIRFTKSEA